MAVARLARAREHDLAAVVERHARVVLGGAGDGAERVERQAKHAAIVGAAGEQVAAEGFLAVPLEETCEGTLPGVHRAVETARRRAGRIAGEELDRADLPRREVDGAARAVPDAHAVVEVAGFEAVEGEGSAALERHAHLGVEIGAVLDGAPQPVAVGLDAGDIAEARHEGPAQVEGAVAPVDLDAEDLERGAPHGQAAERGVGGPGVLVLPAIEIMAPEGFLPPAPAQPPLVGRAGVRRDTAVEQGRVRLRLGHRGRLGARRLNQISLRRTGQIADDQGEEEEPGDDGPASDDGLRHGANLRSPYISLQ